MIGHQTISQDVDPVFFAIFSQPSEVDVSVLIGEEDITAAVTALREVMRNAGEDGSCHPGHRRSLAAEKGPRKGLRPLFLFKT